MLFNRIASVAAVVAFISNAALCQDIKDEDPAWQRYTQVLRGSTLEYWKAEPFFIKMDYQLYDLDGKPSQKGTVEETWQDEKRSIHIHSPALDVTE